MNRRSIAKSIGKEYEVATLYFKDRLKPCQIAKDLRMNVNKVYRIVEGLKRNAKKINAKLE